MAPALLLALAGLAAPYAIRAGARSGAAPRLVAGAYLAALLLAWAGVLALVAELAAPGAGVLGACGVLLASLWSGGATAGAFGGLAAYALLPGRGVLAATRACRLHRLTRGRMLAVGEQRDGYIAAPMLGTLAVTVGVLRPLIVVDVDRFDALSAAERRVILAHERGHARGLHPLLDLVARVLAAGLAPWPGAKVAYAEVRRHLEAAADDHAARRADPQVVARAIATAALGPAPGALGAAGWHVWRVQRLLRRPKLPAPSCVAAAGGIAGAGLFGLQTSAHALVGIHLLPLLVLTCHV